VSSLHNDITSQSRWVITNEAETRATILSGIADEKEFYRRSSIIDFLDVKGKTVLDFGCGVGRISKRVIERGAKKYIGVDWSHTMLEQARKIHAGIEVIEFIQNDGDKIPVGDVSVDIVVAELVLQHNSKEASLTIFNEVIRVLKENGQFIGNIPRDGTFVGGFSEGEIRQIFTGFSLKYFEDPTVIWYLQLILEKVKQ